jgi:single stranded DNA-binding protein
MPRNSRRDDEPKRVVAVAGVVGTRPEYNDEYNVLNFRLAVTKSYDEDAEATWFDVAVWNEGLIESVEAEIDKGMKVAVEGTYSEREYDGKIYKKINAAKVGLIEWLKRSKGDSGSKSRSSGSSTRRRSSRDEDEDDEDERPTRRTASRSRSSAPASSRAAKDDTDDDDLPF